MNGHQCQDSRSTSRHFGGTDEACIVAKVLCFMELALFLFERRCRTYSTRDINELDGAGNKRKELRGVQACRPS